jgi:hypothetical protein
VVAAAAAGCPKAPNPPVVGALAELPNALGVLFWLLLGFVKVDVPKADVGWVVDVDPNALCPNPPAAGAGDAVFVAAAPNGDAAPKAEGAAAADVAGCPKGDTPPNALPVDAAPAAD